MRLRYLGGGAFEMVLLETGIQICKKRLKYECGADSVKVESSFRTTNALCSTIILICFLNIAVM
jgi:hypothetical protein